MSHKGPFWDEYKNVIKRLLLASFLLSLLCNYSFAQRTVPKDALITLERNPGIGDKLVWHLVHSIS
jgi:hypothetical protein